jgi:tRNA(fMet)-specific endonuclease VapC
MALFVLDTDILSLYREGNAVVCPRVDAHPDNELAIAVISVEEQLAGWFGYLRQAKHPPDVARAYRELAAATQFFAEWHILPYTETAIACCNQLVGLKLNVRKQDLRIAAIALENSATVVTRNVRDFSRVPNLVVENWAV